VRNPAWRRAGDLGFLSGLIAVDPDTATIVRGDADLPPELRARVGQAGEFSTDVKEGPILAQSGLCSTAFVAPSRPPVGR
jgi:hypothetical protein